MNEIDEPVMDRSPETGPVVGTPDGLASDGSAAIGGDEHMGQSLRDDLMALLEDGQTYARAEVAFQKSRGAFLGNRGKQAVGLGAAAFGVFHLALIAITVGLVLALVPIVGPWIATGIVGVMLIVFGLLLLRMLKARVDDIRSAFRTERR